MRVKIREVVDLDKPVDISRLSPMQRLSVALTTWYRSGELYKRKLNRKLEQEFREKVKREELVKDLLMSQIHLQLTQNEEMGKRGLVCSEATIVIDRKQEKALREVVKHKEFISYNIKILDCHPDLLRSYAEIPLLVKVTTKG